MDASTRRIQWTTVGLALAMLGLGLAWLFATGCGNAPTAPPDPLAGCGANEPALTTRNTAGYAPGVLVADGACREYTAFVPASYDGSRPLPLVVALHGYTGNPMSMASSSGLSLTAEAEGFIIVYPAGVAGAWDLSAGGRDIRFLRALVDRIQQRANVDRRRVYVTGFSMGGGMANRAACDLADVFAAAAPISGSYQGYLACQPQRPVPILSVHGSADPVIPPQGTASGWPPIAGWLEFWGRLDGCGPTPAITDRGDLVETSYGGCGGFAEVRLLLVDGLGHSWWMPANDEIWAFFTRHPFPG